MDMLFTLGSLSLTHIQREGGKAEREREREEREMTCSVVLWLYDLHCMLHD